MYGMYEDPEKLSYAREQATAGTFEVVVLHDGEEIGTLDRTFSTDFDAEMMAHQKQIPDVGIETEVREITSDEPALR